MKFFAHTASGPDGRLDPDESRWQPLSDHLRNVADLAKKFAAALGLTDEAELAGLLHDLGNADAEFQKRIAKAAGLSEDGFKKTSRSSRSRPRFGASGLAGCLRN